MANAIITFAIMADSPEADCEAIKEKALSIAKDEGAKGELQSKIVPVAFGLKQVQILGMYEVGDNKDFDSIADKMSEIENVASAKVENMDLAMG